MQIITIFLNITIGVTVSVLLAACGNPNIPSDPHGHQPDGTYILYPYEMSYTCDEFSGAITYSLNDAFHKTNEGNRQAVLTVASNLLVLGMGAVPRGIELGGGMRKAGTQEMTKALTLDNAARDNGCDGVDIVEFVDEKLGEGAMDQILEKIQGEMLDPILDEERAMKHGFH